MTNSTNVSSVIETSSFRFPTEAGFLIPVYLTGFVLNIMAIITLTKCKRLVKSIKYFTLNLAVSDTLACVFYPSALVLGQIACSFTWPFLVLVFITSTIFPVFLAIDRCIAIVFISRYNSWISSFKISIICVSCWLLSFAASFSFASILHSDASKSSNESICLQCLHALVNNRTIILIQQIFYVIMCIAMFKSCHYILKYTSRLKLVSPVVQENICQQRVRRERLSLAVIYISASFFVFSLPTMVFITITLFGLVDFGVVIVFYYITIVLRLLNSLINPFLYVWRLSECRVRFLLVFCSCNDTLKSRGQTMNVRDVLGFTFEEMKNSEQPSGSQNVENNMHQTGNACSSGTG